MYAHYILHSVSVRYLDRPDSPSPSPPQLCLLLHASLLPTRLLPFYLSSRRREVSRCLLLCISLYIYIDILPFFLYSARQFVRACERVCLSLPWETRGNYYLKARRRNNSAAAAAKKKKGNKKERERERERISGSSLAANWAPSRVLARWAGLVHNFLFNSFLKPSVVTVEMLFTSCFCHYLWGRILHCWESIVYYYRKLYGYNSK